MKTKKIIKDLANMKILTEWLFIDVFILIMYFENLRESFLVLEEMMVDILYLCGGYNEEGEKEIDLHYFAFFSLI